MTGEWYPGHMAKTKRLLAERIKEIDVVLVLLDARAPKSSLNSFLLEVFESKPKIYLLNKNDLADSAITQKWLDYFRKKDDTALLINAQKGKGLRNLIKTSQTLVYTKKKRYVNLGIKNIPIRAGIIGIPNVGKSTLLNHLVQKNVAQVQNKPGLTRKLLWYKINDQFKILDTPGMLWPKFDSETTGFKIALLNSIANYIYDPEKVVDFLLNLLSTDYPHVSQTYFEGINSWKILVENKHYSNPEKKAEEIINKFRKNKYGRITLEQPN